MPKFKITNTSAESKKGPRAVFLTEAGKLLQPGDTCVANRLDSGTEALGDSGVLKIEEGNFPPAPIFTEEEEARMRGQDTGSKARAEDRAKAAEDARAMDERMKAAEGPSEEKSSEDASSEPKASPVSFDEDLDRADPEPESDTPKGKGKSKGKKSKGKSGGKG